MDFVALESIRELQKNDHANEYFIFVTPSEDRCLEESENVHIIELKCPTYPLWNVNEFLMFYIYLKSNW